MIHLAAWRPQPVSLQQATPAIEQFLLNEGKRRVIADDLQDLRRKATIKYVGDGAPPSPSSSVPEPPPRTTLSPTLGPGVTATPQVVPIESNPASTPSVSTIDSGMGFKK